MYTSIEEGFMRTRIPVKEACLTGEPVARSQARRNHIIFLSETETNDSISQRSTTE